MELTGWGQYPRSDARVTRPVTAAELLEKCTRSGSQVIARGMGRSYGDSALAATVIDTRQLDDYIAFDETRGALTCGAGITLSDILNTFLSRGWFLPVTPGTGFITVGGAIASDVHGKNHHLDGSFCDHLESFTLATASQGLVHCSRHSHPALFRATCGGMGLTGIIVSATFTLKPVTSGFIEQTTFKANNLASALELFETHSNAPYSVAWIDCLATGNDLGRSLITLGSHASQGPLQAGTAAALAVPFNTPGALLNAFSIRAFNYLYYQRVRKNQSTRLIHYQPFFYPLDGIANWNRLYGRKGFLQYQFVVPKAGGKESLTAILKRIAASGKGSFLAVLKTFGKGNDNLLSFPMEGYTLALDFKMDSAIFPLLDELDTMVTDHGGRIYLTKDARMSEATFKTSYPGWEAFQDIRREWGADGVFNSLQSLRLGLS